MMWLGLEAFATQAFGVALDVSRDSLVVRKQWGFLFYIEGWKSFICIFLQRVRNFYATSANLQIENPSQGEIVEVD